MVGNKRNDKSATIIIHGIIIILYSIHNYYLVVYIIQNFNKLISLMGTVINKNYYHFKTMFKQELKIYSNIWNKYKLWIDIIRKEGLVSHEFSSKDERVYRIVKKNLHPSIRLEIISGEIENAGNKILGPIYIFNAWYDPNKISCQHFCQLWNSLINLTCRPHFTSTPPFDNLQLLGYSSQFTLFWTFFRVLQLQNLHIPLIVLPRCSSRRAFYVLSYLQLWSDPVVSIHV